MAAMCYLTCESALFRASPLIDNKMRLILSPQRVRSFQVSVNNPAVGHLVSSWAIVSGAASVILPWLALEAHPCRILRYLYHSKHTGYLSSDLHKYTKIV